VVKTKPTSGKPPGWMDEVRWMLEHLAAYFQQASARAKRGPPDAIRKILQRVLVDNHKGKAAA
jgi:hypothetical protein